MENVGSAGRYATLHADRKRRCSDVDRGESDEKHPVAATFFKQFGSSARQAVVMDPRGKRFKNVNASAYAAISAPAPIVSMLIAIMHVIVEENCSIKQ